jgi:phage I-like protein
MPVDMDHALDRHTQAEAPAAGWIEELAARDGVSGREYRFIRPVVMVTKAGGVMAVKRAGLTNAPAITLQALCAVEEDPVNTEADAA